MNHEVIRYHDISTGHRVVGHENKCRHLHGHNYRVHFYCVANKLDRIGRVIDFGVVKEKLCMWLENNWDHKFLAWDKDTVMINASNQMVAIQDIGEDFFSDSIVWLPFNPTAENMAQYLVSVIGRRQLQGTGITLRKVVIDETRKCSASFEL